ncbi:MAG: hypothetical protein ACYCSJ_01375 [Acidimicrobiales bacterium]
MAVTCAYVGCTARATVTIVTEPPADWRADPSLPAYVSSAEVCRAHVAEGADELVVHMARRLAAWRSTAA